MSKIPGVPDGWELVRIGNIEPGEWCIDTTGKPKRHTGGRSSYGGWLIIRRIEPICTWQHGVFADGWLVQDRDGDVWLHLLKPRAAAANGYWISGPDESLGIDLVMKAYIDPPKFRSDLPWTERIQQVGPTIEAQLKEVST